MDPHRPCNSLACFLLSYLNHPHSCPIVPSLMPPSNTINYYGRGRLNHQAPLDNSSQHSDDSNQQQANQDQNPNPSSPPTMIHGAVHPSPYPLPSIMHQPNQHGLPSMHVHSQRRTNSLSPHHNPNPLPGQQQHPHPMHQHPQQRPDVYYAPNAALLYTHATTLMAAAAASANGAPSVNDMAHSLGAQFGNGNAPPRLPPILQVEKQQVTTSATQAASASRRRNEAHFVCPVPGCGSTFTRRFNLRGMSLIPFVILPSPPSWPRQRQRSSKSSCLAAFILGLTSILTFPFSLTRSPPVTHGRATVCL